MKRLSGKIKRTGRILIGTIAVLALFLPFVAPFLTALNVMAAPDGEKIVIVIDPGNGGKSNGCEYFDLKEKSMNLAVAKSLKNTLECFDGVKVLLTRKDDSAMTYTQRAAYASAKKADYFISLHFNESELHRQTGCQIYVSSREDARKRLMPIAQSIADSMQDMGVPTAGIYTCTDSEGNDYYGMIRKCEDKGIPAMLVQHLFMDREEYLTYIDSPEKLAEIGKNDAIAIARALHLNSNSLIYKFENTPDVEWDEPVALKDTSTYPDKVEIEVKEFEQITNRAAKVTFSVNAAEANSVMAGYKVSMDGGKHYSDLQKFDYGAKGDFNAIIRNGEGQKVVVTAYNTDGLSVTSNELRAENEIKLDPEFTKHQQEALEEESSEISSENGSEVSSEEGSELPGDFIVDDNEEELNQEAQNLPADSDSEEADIHDHDPKLNSTQAVVVIFGALMGLAICILLYVIQKKEMK